MSINKRFLPVFAISEKEGCLDPEMLWIWINSKGEGIQVVPIYSLGLSFLCESILHLHTKIVRLYICLDVYTLYVFTDCASASTQTRKGASHFIEKEPSRTENEVHSCGLSALP